MSTVSPAVDNHITLTPYTLGLCHAMDDKKQWDTEQMSSRGSDGAVYKWEYKDSKRGKEKEHHVAGDMPPKFTPERGERRPGRSSLMPSFCGKEDGRRDTVDEIISGLRPSVDSAYCERKERVDVGREMSESVTRWIDYCVT